MLFTKQTIQSEEQLLQACKRGDERARNQVYQQWASYMKGVCYRYVGNMQLAEDVMHDAWIKVFTKLDQLQWQREGSFKAWVVRVMVNACIDYLKQARRLTSMSIEYAEELCDEPETDENSASLLAQVSAQGIAKEDLLQLLESLPEANRVVFNLYAIEQLRHRDIADMLGIAEEASRTRLKRARKQLQDLLAERCRHHNQSLAYSNRALS